MRPGRRGMMKVLEEIPPGAAVPRICGAVKAAGFGPLDSLGPAHIQAAADSWRLCRLGVFSELLSVLRELAALPGLELLLSFALDLSAEPLAGAWPADHPLRVARLAHRLATVGVRYAISQGELRWSALLTEPALEGLWLGALLHDVGKLLLPPAVRDNPGMPSDQELQCLVRHPQIGHAALSQVAWPWPELLPVVLHHHERWDGSGYPSGLTGEEIPWAAQLVGLADFWENLTTPRAYRRAFSIEQLVELLRGDLGGSCFNPVLIRALLHILGKVPGL
jgi:hypothetical protein